MYRRIVYYAKSVGRRVMDSGYQTRKTTFVDIEKERERRRGVEGEIEVENLQQYDDVWKVTGRWVSGKVFIINTSGYRLFYGWNDGGGRSGRWCWNIIITNRPSMMYFPLRNTIRSQVSWSRDLIWQEPNHL